jgi:hypothetical protein
MAWFILRARSALYSRIAPFAARASGPRVCGASADWIPVAASTIALPSPLAAGLTSRPTNESGPNSASATCRRISAGGGSSLPFSGSAGAAFFARRPSNSTRGGSSALPPGLRSNIVPVAPSPSANFPRIRASRASSPAPFTSTGSWNNPPCLPLPCGAITSCPKMPVLALLWIPSAAGSKNLGAAFSVTLPRSAGIASIASAGTAGYSAPSLSTRYPSGPSTISNSLPNSVNFVPAGISLGLTRSVGPFSLAGGMFSWIAAASWISGSGLAFPASIACRSRPALPASSRRRSTCS